MEILNCHFLLINCCPLFQEQQQQQNPESYAIQIPPWSSPLLCHKSPVYQVSICTESLDMCFIVPEGSAFAHTYPPPHPTCYHVGSQVLSLSLLYTCALFLHWSFCLPLSNVLLYSLFLCLTFLPSNNIFFYFMFTWDAQRLHSLDSPRTWQSLVLSDTKAMLLYYVFKNHICHETFFENPSKIGQQLSHQCPLWV